LVSNDLPYVELKSSPKLVNDDCGDLLTLRNGDEIKVKVLELTTTEIKYKRCDNIDGPLHAISKSEVFSIKYSNGTKEIIPQLASTNDSKATHWATLTALGCSLLAILLIYVLGIVFLSVIGAAALVLSIIGYKNTKDHPEKYKGLNLALAAVIISGIVLLLVVLAPIFFIR
jgi:hypothetical protein